MMIQIVDSINNGRTPVGYHFGGRSGEARSRILKAVAAGVDSPLASNVCLQSQQFRFC